VRLAAVSSPAGGAHCEHHAAKAPANVKLGGSCCH
jgi:hypothetical protein